MVRAVIYDELERSRSIQTKTSQLVMAGLVPAISHRKAKPYLMIGIAGTSPAMTTERVEDFGTRVIYAQQRHL